MLERKLDIFVGVIIVLRADDEAVLESLPTVDRSIELLDFCIDG